MRIESLACDLTLQFAQVNHLAKGPPLGRQFIVSHGKEVGRMCLLKE